MISGDSNGGEFTTLTIGDIYIYQNIITGRSDLTNVNLYLKSKGTSGYLSLSKNVYIGGDANGPFSHVIQAGGTADYYGANFTVYGSGDPDLFNYGMFWTSTGTYENTLTINGNLRVIGEEAVFKTGTTITSDAVITLGAPVEGENIDPTATDLGIEFKWHTNAITSFTITSISLGSPTTITTSVAHGYITNDEVVISNSDSLPNIDGIYNIIVTGVYTFTIDEAVTTPGTTGNVSKAYSTGFMGFDYQNQRLKYYSDCNNVGDVFSGTSFGDMDINRVYTSDEGLVIGDDSDTNIYINSDDLIIKHTTQDKDMIFYTNVSGSNTEMLRLDGSTKIVKIPNDTGFYVGASDDLQISISSNDVYVKNSEQDKDIYINTNTNGSDTNCMFLQGSTNYVGIGISSPNTELDVNGTVTSRSGIVIGDSNQNGSWKLEASGGVMYIYKKINGSWSLRNKIT